MKNNLEKRALIFARMVLDYWDEFFLAGQVSKKAEEIFGCHPSRVNDHVFVRGVEKVLEEIKNSDEATAEEAL